MPSHLQFGYSVKFLAFGACLPVLHIMPNTSCNVGCITYIVDLELEIILCIPLFPFFFNKYCLKYYSSRSFLLPFFREP